MKITIWGTRGSAPNANADKIRFGGNTTCIEVRTNSGDCIILDAGTGIRDLGTKLLEEDKPKTCTICFTHSHWDHMYGITAFTPLFAKNWNIDLYGPVFGSHNWQQTFETIFTSSYFPVVWEQIGKRHTINEFAPNSSFQVGSALIETLQTSHPGGNVAYKITADGWTFFFSGDHEWGTYNEQDSAALEKFMKGADVILADSHFFAHEYPAHIGWGHSTMDQWIEHTQRTGAKLLLFTHHHPEHTDEELDQYLLSIYKKHSIVPYSMALAYDGMVVNNDMQIDKAEDPRAQFACPMCAFSRKVSHYADYGLVLERILTEARSFGHADAGTVYLLDKSNRLAFSYAQNETLFPGSAANKMIYLNASIPLDTRSIAGYVALRKISLNLPNVYSLPSNVPYKFNSEFDKTTGYSTVSILAVPLIGVNKNVIGVLQLINSLDEGGKPQPFTSLIQSQVEQIAILAADTIERNRTATELIVRMLETSSLRDPAETAGHVMRVGSVASELYQRWAEKRNVPIEEIRTAKDTIKHAAMLHDVGKVGIPDNILKKPGKLDDYEFNEMKKHTYLGSSLFKNPTSNLDKMALNIALHHHQKWDGSGYSGNSEVPSLAGEEIPWEARITALADVYDALISKRCYKEPMSQEQALEIIRKDAGKHFDPEMVEAFFEIKEILLVISQRFADDEACTKL